MVGRKQPAEREEDRDREYRMMQKRMAGEEVVGDEAPDLHDKGPAAQVAREREAYAEKKDILRRQDL